MRPTETMLTMCLLFVSVCILGKQPLGLFLHELARARHLLPDVIVLRSANPCVPRGAIRACSAVQFVRATHCTPCVLCSASRARYAVQSIRAARCNPQVVRNAIRA